MSRTQCLPGVPFAYYYVFRKAAQNRKLLTHRSDVEAFWRLLNPTLSGPDMLLHFAYVDEDEMHLGVRAGEIPVSKAIGSFCEKFAHEINHSRDEAGPLFRPHAHILLVQPGPWLLLVGRCIHWIPAWMGLQRNETDVIVNTDTFYRSRKDIRGLCTRPIFHMVSGGSRDLNVQNCSYRKQFGRRPTIDEVELLRTGSRRDRRILGDPEFIAKVCRDLGLPPCPSSRYRLCAEEELRRLVAMVIEVFHEACGTGLAPMRARSWQTVTTLEAVCSRSRKQPLPMVRALCASLLVERHRVRPAQVEHLFFHRPRTLSAKRRLHYRVKFQRLFSRSFEQSFGSAAKTACLRGQCEAVRSVADSPSQLKESTYGDIG